MQAETRNSQIQRIHTPTGRRSAFVLIALAIAWAALSSTGFAQASTIVPLRSNQPPQIDGKLNDAVWQQSQAYEQFTTYEPVSGQQASEKTIAYAAYDDENLYFAFRCLDTQASKITASMTKRDNIQTEDKVGVFLDFYHDRQSAVGFFVNPLGIQEDVVIDEQFSTDASEDFVWFSAGTQDTQGYVAEIRIPLKSIRYQPGDEVTMGISFWRRIIRLSEWQAYPAVGKDRGIVLTQLGTIVYSGLPQKRTFEVLPTITHAYNDASGVTDNDPNVGVTAKIGLSVAFTLDATLYPDFNQVEADASQVEFNERSAVIYDEKRPFFLEDTENLFVAGVGDYNNSHVPVAIHTRKIVDPITGIKLTGRPGSSHVIAALVAVDRSPRQLEGRSENAIFGIGRYKKLLSDDSYVGTIFSGRSLEKGHSAIIGTDGRYRFNNTTSVQFDYLNSQDRDPTGGATTRGYGADLVLRFRNDKYQGDMSFNTVSENFDLATGFINRNGIRSLNAGMERAFYPTSNLINAIRPAYWGRASQDVIYDMRETSHKFFLTIEMPRVSRIYTNYRHEKEIYAGTQFDRSGWETYVTSQPHKTVFASIYHQTGAKPFYDPANPYQGDEQVLQFRLTVRPNEKIALEGSTTRVRFEERATGNEIYNIHIHRAKLTYQANRYLFFRTIGEYNDANQRITTDFLASFTYIPGTVCHLGYGALYEKEDAVSSPVNTRREFQRIRRGLFIKAAYNWRL